VADALWDEFTQIWPDARGISVEYRWACFRPAHPDLMPVIDRVPGLSNAWLTSGHYKTGILLAPATGRALAQWIKTGIPPAQVEPFSSARLLVGR
jgi:glycine/D-amino acid oxidase-like deaminating enzyme